MSTNSRKHSAWTEQEHKAVRDMLPEYATTEALGRTPAPLPPDIAQHLADCADCRALCDRILELTAATFDGRIAAAPPHPGPDLRFLGRAQAASSPPNLGRMIITLSQELLMSLAPPAAVRAGNGRQLYRYGLKPDAQPDLQIQIEVFRNDREPELGRLEITVEVTTRDPLDQAASTVILRYGDVEQQASTDDVGRSIFEAVPLSALPGLEIEVVPCRPTERADDP